MGPMIIELNRADCLSKFEAVRRLLRLESITQANVISHIHMIAKVGGRICCRFNIAPPLEASVNDSCTSPVDPWCLFINDKLPKCCACGINRHLNSWIFDIEMFLPMPLPAYNIVTVEKRAKSSRNGVVVRVKDSE